METSYSLDLIFIHSIYKYWRILFVILLLLILALIHYNMIQNSSLLFTLVTNDTTPTSSIKLINFKSIISKALPNMDRPHIIRLLFDDRHESLIAFEGKQIVGGACFASFKSQKFVELAFLAVKAEKRIQGYGKKIMNKLKSILQKRKIEYMITYGDNMALGFFKKQGFSDKISMPLNLYEGFIKEYDGGKLMQCKIHPTIDYINVENIIKMQKQYLISKIKSLSMNQAKFTGDKITQAQELSNNLQRKTPNGYVQQFKRDPRQIPGITESGWSWQQHDRLKKFDIEPFNIRCFKLLNSIKRHPQSKYFILPVSQQQVPSYHKIIKKPMDISTMWEKVKKEQYLNQQHFCSDVDLIFANCFEFNHPESVYFKNGMELRKIIKPELQAFRHIVISTEVHAINEKYKK